MRDGERFLRAKGRLESRRSRNLNYLDLLYLEVYEVAEIVFGLCIPGQ